MGQVVVRDLALGQLIAAAIDARMAAPRARAFSAADWGSADSAGFGGGGGLGASWWAVAAACSTSCSVIAPCGPVPVRPLRSTPATRPCAATGDTLPVPDRRLPRHRGGDGRGLGAGVSASVAAAGHRRRPPAGLLAGFQDGGQRGADGHGLPDRHQQLTDHPVVASTRSRLRPWWFRRRRRSGPRVTVSPGCTSHSLSVPSSMSAPRAGIVNSIISAHSPVAPFPAGARIPEQARTRFDLVGLRQRHPRDVWRTGSAPRWCRRVRRARRGRERPSTMRALTSAARLPVRQPSSTITARCVRRTDSRMVASSSGRSARRSTTSRSIPVCANCSAASRTLGGCRRR